MTSTPRLPEQVTVHVSPMPPAGTAVDICFGMAKRNDFHYVIFVGDTGTAAISMNDLLKWFDGERSAFTMDYADPRSGFSGKIEARVLGPSDVDSALKAFETYRKYLPYPEDYEHHLRSARGKSQGPCAYLTKVKLE